MSVMNRKMFSDREARKRLRDMGGIMSSFPQLAGEVQRFSDGGPVTYGQWQQMSRSERRDAGLPVSVIGGELYFNRFGVGMGRNDPETGEPLARRSIEEAAQGEFGGLPAYMTEQAGTVPEPGAARPPRAPRRGLTIEEAAQGEFAGLPDDMAGPPETRVRREEEAPAADEAIAESSEITEDMIAAAEEAGTRVEPDELERLRTEYESLLAENERLAAGEEDPDPEDLESLAQRRIDLYERLFGEEEPSRRDRGMQLAMIGLAIAAGQSPNAMTNIASGALAGLQAMTAQEAARRDRRRALRQSAVEGVFRERAAEREEGAGARNELLEEFRDGYNRIYQAALGDAAGAAFTDPTEAAQYAQTVADRWAQMNYPDFARPASPEASPSGVPQPTTREQIQELPPGTRFIWTDGREYTRS